MTRFLVWSTLIALIFAAKAEIEAVSEFAAKHNPHTSQPPGGVQAATPTPSINTTAQSTGETNNNPINIVANNIMAGAQTKKTFEERCEELLPPTTVSFTIAESLTVFDYSKNILELTALSENTRNYTLGLTMARPQTTFVWGMQLLEDEKTKRVCMRPQLQFTVHAGTQNVFVGKEFDQGSCAFKEIHAHEMRHVDENKNIATKVAESTYKYIRASAGNRIIFGKSREEVEGYVLDAIKHHWLPFANENFVYYAAAHKQIDTPAEYARVNNSCNGEVVAVMQQANLGNR